MGGQKADTMNPPEEKITEKAHIPNPQVAHSPEKASHLETLENNTSVVISETPATDFLVNLEDLAPEANPINWSKKKKWTLIALMSFMSLITNLCTIMCAPAAPVIIADLDSTSSSYQTLLVTIWELGEACAPLIYAPMSETLGRAWIYQAANVSFLVWSIAQAVSSDIQMFIAFRFLNGLSVANVVLNPSIVGDMFVTEEQGGALAIMGLVPQLGPVLGPIIGGYVAEKASWRWIFWIPAIMVGLLQVVFFFVFRETYKVTILKKKAAEQRRLKKDGRYHTEYDAPFSWKRIFSDTMIRPFKLLILSPVLIALSLQVSLVFGLVYVIVTTLPTTFEDKYGFSTGASGLVYLGLTLGIFIATPICTVTVDMWAKKMKAQGKMKPEQRLPPMIVGSLLIPVSFFWYGWSIEANAPFIVPTLATGLLGFSLIPILLAAIGYIVDAYGIHSASAIAANLFIRCLVGALFPLAAPPLYRELGLGWGSSVLGFIALAFVPVPVLLMVFGEKIRKKSKLLVTT